MRASLITTFLLFITVCSQAQQANPPSAAIQAIQKIENDTLRMDSLYEYAADKQEIDPKEALSAGKILLEDAENHKYKTGIAGGHFELALAYEYTADYPQSLKHYIAALKMQKELKRYNMQINSLLGISRIYDATNDIPKERKYIEEAMAICDRYKDDKRVRNKRGQVLGYLATIYKIEGKYDTAINIYKQSIEQARKDGNKIIETGSICNMAIALKSKKDYPASLAAYKQALTLVDTVNDFNGFGIITDNMAILFYNMGDYPLSEAYSLKALALLKKANNEYATIDIYDNLKNTYRKWGKYPEALEYYDKWSSTKDTLFNKDKSQQIAELQAKYDSDSKDKQIAVQNAKISFDRKVNLFLAVISILLLLMGVLAYWNQRRILHRNRIIEAEKKRSEELLRNILPEETANELMAKGFAGSHKYDQVTVMFIDFVGFTLIAEGMKAEDLVGRIDHYFSAFDNIILKYGLEKIKTIGDSYMCAGGLPVVNTTNHIDVLHAAMEILKYMESDESGHFFKVRIGVNSGPLVAGVVGKHKFQYDIWGDTVNVAARIEEHSEPGRINISGQTYELVKDSFDCEYRGKIKAKNKGELDMYFVKGISPLSKN